MITVETRDLSTVLLWIFPKFSEDTCQKWLSWWVRTDRWQMNFSYKPGIRGAGAIVNADNSQYGTSSNNQLRNCKFINAVTHFTTSGAPFFVTANGLSYPEAHGTGIPGYTGGAWLQSNQSYYDTMPECTPKIESNGYICTPFAPGMSTAGVRQLSIFDIFWHVSGRQRHCIIDGWQQHLHHRQTYTRF